MRLPLHVLVLCTANSARSQIAEALLRDRGAERIVTESAGATPAERVNPGAVKVLEFHGVSTEGHYPKRTDQVLGRGWDLVITVCDHAKEACPVLPGATITGHWGVEDPAGAPDEDAAFARAYRVLSLRVDRFLALPFEELQPDELKAAVDRIGTEFPLGDEPADTESTSELQADVQG